MRLIKFTDHRHHLRRSWRFAALFALALFAAGTWLDAATAEARPRPRSSNFAANKTFGVGIMLGVPTGFSGKYYLSSSTAVDFGLGVVRGFGDDGLHLHADFLWHPVSIVSAAPFEVPIYIGLGGRFADFDDNDNNDFDDDDYVRAGARAPLGIMLDFNNVPLDVFFELALVLDVVGRDVPDADLNAALGVRYYFY